MDPEIFSAWFELRERRGRAGSIGQCFFAVLESEYLNSALVFLKVSIVSQTAGTECTGGSFVIQLALHGL